MQAKEKKLEAHYTPERLAIMRDALPYKNGFWQTFADYAGVSVRYLIAFFNGETALGNSKPYPDTINQRRILFIAYLMQKYDNQIKLDIEEWERNQKDNYSPYDGITHAA